jgi:hypothetical protein
MTTTQVSPAAGGAWSAVNKDSRGSATKTQTTGVTLAPHQTSQLCSALNEWNNAGGTGTAAVRAQARANALGVQIREN